MDDSGVAVPGYADGSPYSTTDWIADFDDDNQNNIPDNLEGVIVPTDGEVADDVIAQSIRAPPRGADGIPDGAEATREPLFLPSLDAIIGSTASTRGLGNAVVVPTVSEVAVDFVTYANYPVTGVNTVVSAIGSGGGLGLLPPNPTSSTTVTCPPFTTEVTTQGVSDGGKLVQSVTSTPGTYKFSIDFSTANDFDGDGIANYNDNCDAVANPTQADGDSDGIGDACDSAPATTDPDDKDGDGYVNPSTRARRP